MTPPGFSIRPAQSAGDMAAVRGLFEDYAASLSVELSYQDFAAEVTALPGKYAPPSGVLLLAVDPDGAPLGCAALRSLSEGDAEMKRLYVCPAARGLGLGRALVAAIVSHARDMHYRRIKLDTLPEMTAALVLYRAIGFAPIARYYDTPVDGTVFLGIEL